MQAASLLDKLLKEIVMETQYFDVEKFVPLMKQYINDKSPHIRRLLISWIDVMDNVPGIDILDFLPEFLDGLFDMLSDPHREIRQVRFPLFSSLGIGPSSPHASIGNPHVGSGRCEHQLDDRYGDHPNQ